MKRIPELDAIRGLAALGVVLFHAYPTVFFLGWSCVDLFFVLSGFLITGIIIDNCRTPGFLSAFYIRRVLRIWPVYYLTLAAVLVLNACSRTGYGVYGLPQNLFFLQNIQGYWFGKPLSFPASFDPSWSVAVEEQYYLMWPPLLLLTGCDAIPVIAIVTLVVTMSARAIGFPYNILLGRADGLALGCLLAYLASDPHHLRRLSGAFAVVALTSVVYLGVMAGAWWRDPVPHWIVTSFFAFGLLYFSTLGLVVTCTGHRWLMPLRWSLLSRLGRISYALYLFHMPIFTFFPVLMRSIHGPFVGLFTWIAIFSLPMLSYRFVEQPILSWKDRFGYRREVVQEPVSLAVALRD